MFNLAVGYEFFAGEEAVRWVYVAARCLTDGTLGVYTDWKIDYSPSAQLLSRAKPAPVKPDIAAMLAVVG